MSDAANDPDEGTADTDQDRDGGPAEGISDDQLPEDLQPGEDNPLAQPLDPDAEQTKDPEELDMRGGKPADQQDPDEDA